MEPLLLGVTSGFCSLMKYKPGKDPVSCHYCLTLSWKKHSAAEGSSAHQAINIVILNPAQIFSVPFISNLYSVHLPLVFIKGRGEEGGGSEGTQHYTLKV